MLDTIIFDLDGTLLDTLQDLADSVNAALAANGFPMRTVDEVRRFVGNGVRRLMELAIPEGEKNPLFEQTLAQFKEHYAVHCMDKTAPYEGILPLLTELKERGYKLAVVSNKFDAAVKELNRQYFGELIPVAIGEKSTVRKKPAPDSVFAAIEALKSDTGSAIYVGDSEVDILTAKNAGIPCALVTWGFRDKAYLHENGGELFFDDADALKTYITDFKIG